MDLRVRLGRWSAWAPGVATPDEWRDWAAGGRAIELPGGNPALSHLDGMFKRRLSQLSRMILHVGHEAAGGRELPLAFASRYGEVGQQYKIARNLIEAGEVAPAAFSLSVFNTPAALLSLSERNHCRASALYGGAAACALAITEAAALIARGEPEVLAVCGDEALPADWQGLLPTVVRPHALALLLKPVGSAPAGEGELTLRVESLDPSEVLPPVPAPARDAGFEPCQALDLAAWLAGGCAGALVLDAPGLRLRLSAEVAA